MQDDHAEQMSKCENTQARVAQLEEALVEKETAVFNCGEEIKQYKEANTRAGVANPTQCKNNEDEIVLLIKLILN